MHLVGFIIRLYYDARSPERQIEQYCVHFSCSVPKMMSPRIWQVGFPNFSVIAQITISSVKLCDSFRLISFVLHDMVHAFR